MESIEDLAILFAILFGLMVVSLIFPQIASASWTPAGRNFVIIATVLVGAADSTKIGAAAAGQAA